MTTENKWRGLEGRGYRLENLGRPAIFLLPVWKLKAKLGKTTIEQNLHRFLISQFGAYTSTTIPSFGVWKNTRKAVVSDECRQYEVSFNGKERIPLLAGKLAEISKLIGEDCVYLKAGQYSCLVYPLQTRKQHQKLKQRS
ncbi:MAG: hypothetical protein G01um101419_96 [Parcubacteria group bacterium Gr01-1014_19]|nr:MAG: hypothetical protein G01um101419_96 [Parcubacteria group bacterium Gr01-1014_19]